jgi:hypothetical protein
MTNPSDAPVIEARIEASVEQFLTDLAGAASPVMTMIGDRLGCTRHWPAPAR